MIRFFKSTLVGVLILGLSLSFLWIALPRTTARVLLAINNTTAGLSEKTIHTNFGDIHYLEGGHGDTIILIHGIYSRKEHWVELARNLNSDFHIIALDLPGFGDNNLLPDEQYSLQNQMMNLATVIDTLDIKNAHIGANSMGAQIASMLAESRPELVRSLAFIGSPLGVPTEIKSDMEFALEVGHIPLLIKSEGDFQARNKWLFPKTPTLPGPVSKTWAQKEISIAHKNEKIWPLVHNFSNISNVLDLAPELNLDTLIIWCDQDRIFHVSGAKKLEHSLPKSTLRILPGCGHVPMLDKPYEVSQIYGEFLQKNFSKNSTEVD